MKQIRFKYETKIIETCYNQLWGTDGGETNCPCCFRGSSKGEYRCCADVCIDPSCKKIPEGCPLEDAKV